MKNKEKLILLLIITLFVMPSMVSNTSADTQDRLYIFYFDAWCVDHWEHEWWKMTDAFNNTYAWTTLPGDEQFLCSTSCEEDPGCNGEIRKVELKVDAFCSRFGKKLTLEPWVGIYQADPIEIPLPDESAEDYWSDEYEITFDGYGFDWDWEDIMALDCNVISAVDALPCTTWCGIVCIYVWVDTTP